MNPSELAQRGFEQLKAGNYEEAKRLFQQSEATTGTSADTQSLLRQAAEAMRQSQPDVAAELYEKVLDRNPTLVEPYLGLARISLATGELEAAQVHASAATHVEPAAGLGWTLLGLVSEAGDDLGHRARACAQGRAAVTVGLPVPVQPRASARRDRQPEEGVAPLQTPPS